MDHRPERRRPRRTHGVTPPPTARPSLPPDQLATPAGTPLLVRVEAVAPDLSDDRLRAIERGQLLRRMNVDVSRATPATRTLLDLDKRQLLRAVTEPGATTGHQRSRLAGQQRTAGPSWVACDPTPARLLPRCDRDCQSRSRMHHFLCGAFRTLAQTFSLHGAVYRSRSPSSY